VPARGEASKSSIKQQQELGNGKLRRLNAHTGKKGFWGCSSAKNKHAKPKERHVKAIKGGVDPAGKMNSLTSTSRREQYGKSLWKPKNRRVERKTHY